MMFCGIPFSMISLLWADQSLLSTLAPFATIFALIVGKYMLKEKIYNRHYVASTLMILGSMLALTFASKNSGQYNIEEIKERLYSKSSLSTLVVNFAIMAIFLVFSYRIIVDIKSLTVYFSKAEAEACLLKFKKHADENIPINYNIQEEFVDSELERIYSLEKAKKSALVQNPKWLKICIFALPWFAGFMSGLLALHAKCTIMLALKFSEDDNSKSPFTYLIFIFTPCFIIFELSLLNIGLRYFDTCYIIPIFKASMVFHNTM